MFNDIGGKIKGLAVLLTWLGIILSVVIGALIASASDDLIVAGFIVIVVGILLSWIGSFCIYGFGQLIENSDKLVSQQNAFFALQRENGNFGHLTKEKSLIEDIEENLPKL